MKDKESHPSIFILALAFVIGVLASCLSQSNEGAKAKRQTNAEDSKASESAPSTKGNGGENKVEDGSELPSLGKSNTSQQPSSSPSQEGISGTYASPDAGIFVPGSTGGYPDGYYGQSGSSNFPDKGLGNPAEMARLVGDWTGAEHRGDREGIWSVTNAGQLNNLNNGPTTGEPGYNQALDEMDCLSPAARTSRASTFVFFIRQGVGNGAWNEEANPCIVRAGRTLKFVNLDSTDHMPHFNGIICQHPDIPDDTMVSGTPSESYSCVPRQPTQLIRTYDHFAGDGGSSRLYIQVVE